MAKLDLRRNLYFGDEINVREKEMYLKELGDSVHNYIKTGVKNRQLDCLLVREEEFREKYEELFGIKEMVKVICERSRRKIGESDYLLSYEKKMVIDRMCEKKEYDLVLEQTSNVIIDVVAKVVSDNLDSVLKDVAYLSHMNMLYELYEKEEKLRREEKEFEKMSQKFQKMADVTKKLSERRRMELEEIEQQVNISQEDLKIILNSCNKYFNVRDRKNQIQVSLSPMGRKYNEYVLEEERRYSNEKLNQLVYKNCNNLMESLENSCERKIRYDVKLEGLNSDKERAIKHKYNKILQEFITSNEDVYFTKEYIVRDKKASVKKNNEKNRIRIPEWDTEVY